MRIANKINAIAKIMKQENIKFASGQVIIGKKIVNYQISIKGLKK